MKLSAMFKRRMSEKQKIVLMQRLTFLLQAKIPLHQSLVILMNQERSVYTKNILHTIDTSITHGRYLYTSFEQQNILKPFDIALIHIGELTGTLPQSLLRITQDMEKRTVMKQKILSALLYPACIAFATLALSGFLTLFIFPKIRTLLAGLNASLPLSTRLLIFIADTIKRYGMLLIFIFSLFVFLLYLSFKKLKFLRDTRDSFLLHIPLIRKIIRLYKVTEITRSLHTLLTAGISITESLKIISSATHHSEYKAALMTMEKSINEGHTISYAMDTKYLFPPIVKDLTSIAETTGRLGDVMSDLSHLHEQELDTLLKTMTGFLEPALMTVMGFIVGFVSLSIITPIYNATSSINH